MSDKISPTVRNRRYGLPSNPWIPYVGDCKAIDTFLDSKGFTWIVPKFFNALLRGISQVLFANNPLSGLIILLSLFWSDVTVGLATTAASSVAILTALLMKQDLGSIRAGLTTYNAALVGCVTASLWFPLYLEHLSPKLWGFIIVGSVLSVLVTSGCANILSSFKFPLPCLTLPFNVINLLIFICLMPPIQLNPTQAPTLNVSTTEFSTQDPMLNVSTTDFSMQHGTEIPTNGSMTVLTSNLERRVRDAIENESLAGTEGTDPPAITEPTIAVKEVSINKVDDVAGKEEHTEKKKEELEWGRVLTGIICSMGQVFAVENLLGSILIYAALLVYSPILTGMCLFGAVVSTLTALLFVSGPDYTIIYAGICGYNGILSAAAVGGFFFVMTCHSFWTATANVLFTVLLQHGLASLFIDARLPIFTLPFVLSTFLFLSVSTSGDHLPRVANISFPEMHRYQYTENQRVKRLNQKMEVLGAEEKELVLEDVRVIHDDNRTSAEATKNGDK